MRKSILAFIGLLISWSCVTAQIIYNQGLYKVNFSNTLHQPRYVSYTLFKGGGPCNDSYEFSNDNEEMECANKDDYANALGGIKYDRGHMANGEDFAKTCVLKKQTYQYYNCLPQTTKLNRGIWRTKEKEIRDWSKSEKLYIVCGGFFRGKKIGKAAVPDYCWKVVQSVKTKKVLFCGWFTNTSTPTLEEISPLELDKRLRSHVILLK